MSLVAPVLSTKSDVQIAEAVGELSATAFPRNLRSVVLTGSLARGEGTWSQDGNWNRLAGDAEFLLVFEEHAALPSAERLARLKDAIRTRLRAAAIDAQIGLSPARPNYLRGLRPHIFAYELLTHGEVVWGDTRVLNLAPKFSPTDIPLEDGFRLLMNRIIELLEALCESDSAQSLPYAVYYRVMKLWLDAATSFLLFQGQYESTYRQRAARLARMVSQAEARLTGSADGPIPLSRFNERVSLATDYKLGTSDRPAGLVEGRGPSGRDALLELVNDAQSLWRWELARLTSCGCASDDELLNRWISAQGVLARMHGWAATAKRSGLTRSARLLSRWGSLALKGSPRRLVYAAASQLFFALPAILGDGESVDCHRLRASKPTTCFSPSDRIRSWRITRKLPVMNGSAAEVSWRSAGRAIAWNYHQFLETTRS